MPGFCFIIYGCCPLILSSYRTRSSEGCVSADEESRRIESSPSLMVSLPRCRGTADPARLAPYAWTWSLMPAWSPSCLEKDATMCFILLTFSSAAAPVTKWDQPPSCLAFSFFIKEKPNALENSALINAHVANFTIFFFKRNKRAESCKEQLWQKCSCALGLRLPMPLLTFNKTFRTRVPRRASPVVISVVAFYTIHDNRCHRCL